MGASSLKVGAARVAFEAKPAGFRSKKGSSRGLWESVGSRSYRSNYYSKKRIYEMCKPGGESESEGDGEAAGVCCASHGGVECTRGCHHSCTG
jgi:hypothetical protein